MATQLKVKCIDQTLTLTSSPVVASGGKLDDIIEFEFCAKWDGYTKTATFYQDKDNVYYSMIDNETNICTIPWEVLQKNGNLYFGVYGIKGDYVRTSQILVYKVVEGAITEGTTPSDPTPTIYQQIVNRLGIIEGKIPSQASTTNQLADKEFVNSSIATNTATFKGTFNIVDDLGLSRTATHEQVANAIATKVTDATNNDYSFVAIPNETITTEIDQYDRYKYNGTNWAYEFTLNNSSFTAEQWDAINSGISSNDVSQIATNKSSITNLQNNKQDKLVSGTNIKTINGVSLLGEGDMETPLPIANASTLGGVKIGSGINVEDDGTISAQEYSLPTASASVKGGIKIGDGLTITDEVVSVKVGDVKTTILQAIYPIGSVYANTSNTNPKSILGFGTWTLLTSTLNVNGIVYGNGIGLGLTNGTKLAVLGGQVNYYVGSWTGIGKAVGKSTSPAMDMTSGKVLGVPTKAQITAQGSGYENATGLTTDTITCYIWKRTAWVWNIE